MKIQVALVYVLFTMPISAAALALHGVLHSMPALPTPTAMPAWALHAGAPTVSPAPIDQAAAPHGHGAASAATANLDPDDDWIVGPPEVIEQCEAALEQAGVTFTESRIPVHRSKSGTHVCGAEQVVRVAKTPGGIQWGRGRSGPKIACGMGMALIAFETIVLEEAQAHFGKDVVRVEHMGTYNCREMAAYPGWVSEHSYANALDIKAFVLEGGTSISVLDDWTLPTKGRVTKAQRAAASFLREVSRRAYEEEVFSVVLTPAFDRAHRNHFHLDLARYRVDGSH